MMDLKINCQKNISSVLIQDWFRLIHNVRFSYKSPVHQKRVWPHTRMHKCASCIIVRSPETDPFLSGDDLVDVTAADDVQFQREIVAVL